MTFEMVLVFSYHYCFLLSTSLIYIYLFTLVALVLDIQGQICWSSLIKEASEELFEDRVLLLIGLMLQC